MNVNHLTSYSGTRLYPPFKINISHLFVRTIWLTNYEYIFLSKIISDFMKISTFPSLSKLEMSKVTSNFHQVTHLFHILSFSIPASKVMFKESKLKSEPPFNRRRKWERTLNSNNFMSKLEWYGQFLSPSSFKIPNEVQHIGNNQMPCQKICLS
jgi:hypothetical protein